jgi:hypothetical protein
MKNLLLIIVAPLLLIIVAPLSLMTSIVAATEGQQVGTQHQADVAMMQSCPMKVSGTDLSVTDVDNGIALTIATKSGEAAELRRRAENMAKMHTEPSDMHGNMMPFTVKYEDVPNGALLTLTPKNPTQLAPFRAKVREHAQQMKEGNCSMMQSMMQGRMDGMKHSESAPKPETKPNEDDTDHSTHHPQGEKK